MEEQLPPQSAWETGQPLVWDEGGGSPGGVQGGIQGHLPGGMPGGMPGGEAVGGGAPPKQRLVAPARANAEGLTPAMLAARAAMAEDGGDWDGSQCDSQAPSAERRAPECRTCTPAVEHDT